MSEVLGIDVSHHQGTIDWSKVAAAGKKFVIMKAQYEAASHRIDEQFEANYKGAGDNGLARGVYIYIAKASMADPEADANALIEKLNGRTLEYGIWLDLEDSTVSVKGKDYIRTLAYTYANIFKAAGYYVGIYCNKSWYNNLIHDDLKTDFDFWIARYPSNDTGIYNASSSLKMTGDRIVAWQYSSKGSVAGISGNVDLNVDYDGVINLSGATTEEKEETNPYREPTTNLKIGSKGNIVKWLQYELNESGSNLTIDGIFGSKTRLAVIMFQQDNNLLVDGIVGSQTRTALKNN